MSLQVALEREDAACAVLRFVVSDTGIGIPADRIENLFELFTQLDVEGPRHPRGGTGLGLAISRQLAEIMGGSIRAESRVGVGSRFWVTIPLAKPEAERTEWSDAGARSAPMELPLRGLPDNLRILLAEDNLVNQTVALGLLKKIGLSASVVQDGREALEVLAVEPYDLVFMDVQMPEVDGLEATRRVRDGSVGAVNQQVPIVAMTAHAMKGDRERCLAAGMNDYVSKPVALDDLAAVVARWAGGDSSKG